MTQPGPEPQEAAGGPGASAFKTIPFDSAAGETVLKTERVAIAARRARLKSEGARGRHGASRSSTGLALSGGGIRSASFCLGVLQALETDGAIDGIDYLSTVSGGGYIGSCLTACMQKTEGAFPFTANGRFDDTPAVRHIRDFSNYLIPRGGWDVVSALGLMLRGLVANAVLALPLVLLAAALLALCFPSEAALYHPGPLAHALAGWTGLSLAALPTIPGFPLTTGLLGFSALFLLAWTFLKSFATSDVFRSGDAVGHATGLASAELSGPFASTWKVLFVVIAATAAAEAQPLALRVILHPPVPAFRCFDDPDRGACVAGLLHAWLQGATLYLAPLGAVVTFLAQRIERARQVDGAGKPAGFWRKLLAGAVLWFAALVIPSALWLACLGIAEEGLSALGPRAGWTLLAAALVAGALACLVNPNATSLHRMYRDRLAKAFLFDPDTRRRDRNNDLWEYTPKLHTIDPRWSPYQIVNASLNIEGSAYANKRGRNADFFEFTQGYVGSDATGYVASERMAEVEPKLDLGTALAISGAAVSPNMGAATVKALVPTLALLNVRLGYWLTNPREAAEGVPSWFRRLVDIRSFLLFKEVFSRISETSKTVYLTDGGNLENLGVYSLLKRKCGLIIAVDAEADPGMGFGSLLKMERFARSDLGALIELPWQAIAERTREVDALFASEGGAGGSRGHHAAACRIDYGEGVEGLLVYVKASLTGDEDDYVLDYKRRHPDFPHETTSDQFFGEEQLEAYRSLGFHAARGVVTGRTPTEVKPREGETVDDARERVVEGVKAALGLRAPPRTPGEPEIETDPGTAARVEG